MTSHNGADEMLEYGMSALRSSIQPYADVAYNELKEVMQEYLNEKISYEEARTKANALCDSSKTLEQLKEIVDESKDFTPIPNPPQNRCFPKKSRHWSRKEDIRLMAGVYRFGLLDWSMISNFVGSGRGRQQCLQRWTRTLNPVLNKETWSKEEDKLLLKVISEQENVSWSKTAMLLGNRSDVQCRYRYLHLSKIEKKKKKEEYRPESKKEKKDDNKVTHVMSSLQPVPLLPMDVDTFLALFQRT